MGATARKRNAWKEVAQKEVKEIKTMGLKTMRSTKIWLALALAAVVMPLTAPSLLAQTPTAKIHGHVQDPTGGPLKGGSVILSTDGGHTAKYTFTTDDNGNYTGDGIAPGTYTMLYRNPDTPPDKVVDEFESVKVEAGADVTQDFDMTRPEYLAKMTPEQRKAADELKAKNAAALKDNAVIKNLNADLGTARQYNALGRKGPCIDAQGNALPNKPDAASCQAAGGKPNDPNDDYQKAEAIMERDTAAKPDESLLWQVLGVAQLGLKKYDDAATSFKKVVELESASKKPRTDLLGEVNNSLGEALADQAKIPESQAAYEAAAKADPKSAFKYYQNEAVMMDRNNQIDATVAAADKAIAADPNKPIPYYLKGKALINKATVDPKTNKIVAPPGCEEAYAKYLELDPNGPFSEDAKSILAELGSTIQTRYRAGKKS
jgi:tetratricopeptide (TPR) repeat protein